MISAKTILSYRESLPSDKVAHLVSSFWEFSVSEKLKSKVVHEIFPDGCVSLIYRRNKELRIDLLLLFGLAIEPTRKEVAPGDVLWGVKFAPSASRKILRTNPADITTQPLFDDKTLPHLTKDLIEKFKCCESFKEATKIFEEKLLELEIMPKDVDEKIADAAEMISSANGEVKIANVAKHLNLSLRQFQRRFQKSSGLTPKQFVRVQRFRASAIKLAKENPLKLVDFAAEMGFSDQAHMSHEFVSLTGRSPKSFAEKLKEIGYSDLVE